ncbi:unnamed protein product [Heligmosomoides polygyrus]|uniref:Uncharacterized protein n=1 Tax=Heligmosomoides polygyrus TaxID=6339 RepID=A0A3P7XWX5_HELPZ|nr:unnamed protein product [Heligmosomoides polygyrus]
MRSLSGGAIDGPRSAHGLTTAYAAAGLRAGWCGKVNRLAELRPVASPVSSSAFAVTYSVRQNHPFIQLETDAKVASLYNCEVWEIPLRTEKAMFHFCLIRPKFIGEIVKLKSKMLPEDLKDILDELLKSKVYSTLLKQPTYSALQDFVTCLLNHFTREFVQCLDEA